MKKIFLLPILLVLLTLTAIAQKTPLPDSIYTGKQGNMHVQGVAVDKVNGYVYFSFTDKLLKMDLSGKLVGSVIGFVGHLGDLDMTDDGKIYGSLEYKNDEIGKGIKKKLGMEETNSEDGFYVAIFDGSRITRPDMDAEKEDLVRTVYMPEVVKDYKATVQIGDKTKPHRFACSGMDGLAFAPAIGSTDPKKYIYIAYGVYGDTDRNDNDYQVILKYDASDWNKYAQHLTQGKLHHSGPEKPLEKYFVKTGSTNYGIQNLAYDPSTGNLLAAVYHGTKPQFPNYDLFVIDGHKKPIESEITVDNQKMKVKTLSLLPAGPTDAATGLRGWHFKWGSTGLCPLGDGLFYISHNEKTKDGQQQTTIHKYKWVGNAENAFVLVR
jgi:hypothetical protein